MNEEKFKEKLEGIEKNKPHFYIMDLDNYTDNFLREIIYWQDEKIKFLENIDNMKRILAEKELKELNEEKEK